MELYTLDENFLKYEVVDRFVSLLWTERYSSEGDMNLVVDASSEMVSKLAIGTFLSITDTDEVMIVETQSIEDGALTVTGRSLLSILAKRPFRMSPDTGLKSWDPLVDDVPVEDSPGGIMADVVTNSAIGPYPFNGLDEFETIPNLTLGAIDTTGDSIVVSVPYAQVLDIIKTYAETFQLGIRLYLESATSEDYSLKFTVYSGRDLTSGQETYPVVRFSVLLDTLLNTKELRSIAEYIDIVYVFRTTIAEEEPGSLLVGNAGIAYRPGFEPSDPYYTGFRRRTLMVLDDSVTTDQLHSWSQLDHDKVMEQKAKDVLANYNFIQMVDGEVAAHSPFKFGTDYSLGDIVELQGVSGALQTARVTEYIRVQDAEGERAYPTIAVIE